MNTMKKLLMLMIAFVVLISSTLNAQVLPDTFKNPILPGFHPDPSICRVDDDYYLVNSSFEWYPGLPVYHSKDLVNWELIGYGMHRPLQVELPEGLRNSGGVFAPTIRHHDGIFYIINTCIDCKGNFYITATDPAGPWSNPVWLDAPGIDPSLFWDENGRCYYVGHGNLRKEQQWPDQQGIWMQELDLVNKTLVGKRIQLTHGHASNAVWAEGPHLFKIDGTYVLMLAEGGTDFNHSVSFHNSDSLWGPYIPLHVNPVLTHRHLGKDYPVHSVGHADLVQTQNDEWWSVMLAKRRVDGYTLLARETFMAKVDFEDHEGVLTPVYNRGEGKLLMEQERPDLPWSPFEPAPVRDGFNGEELDLNWNFLRTPYEPWFQLEEGQLNIKLRPEVLDSLVNPSLIAKRIKHHDFKAATHMTFSSKKENEQAGLIIYRTSESHYQLLKSKKDLILIKTIGGSSAVEARVPFKYKELILSAEASGVDLVFKYGPSPNQMKQIGPVQTMGVVSDELAWGFNGSYVGIYATSNGKESKTIASFHWFDYKGK